MLQKGGGKLGWLMNLMSDIFWKTRAHLEVVSVSDNHPTQTSDTSPDITAAIQSKPRNETTAEKLLTLQKVESETDEQEDPEDVLLAENLDLEDASTSVWVAAKLEDQTYMSKVKLQGLLEMQLGEVRIWD